MPGFSTLEVGKRALLAQRFGLDVTSNNIANVNTPGYSRREAVMNETYPTKSMGNFLGSGVMVDKLRSFREEFFDRDIRTGISNNTAYETDELVFRRVETIFGEPADNGIGDVLGNFFNAFEELALKPESVNLRSNVLSQAQMLVDRFHNIAGNIADTRAEILTSIKSRIDEVNQLTSEIAQLNKNIAQTKPGTGNAAQTMVDQRELKLEELSQVLQVTVTHNENQTVNVYANGINLVEGHISWDVQLEETVNQLTGERTARIVKPDPKTNNVLNRITPQGGELASFLKHFNVTLDDLDSSGGFSVMNRLDALADALVQKVNALTVAGYGLDDTGAVPPGRTFFEPSVGTVTAATIQLSADVKGLPRNIPLSAFGAEPGNNDIAIQIARLATDDTFVNGTNPSEYFATLIGDIGAFGNEAISGKNATRLSTEQMMFQRESLIGVNIDEEAINLIKYQKAFEASSRVINVMDEILSTIISLSR